MRGKIDPRSKGEYTFYQFCESGKLAELGLPSPDFANSQIFSDRKHTFDFIWTQESVLMEVMGGKWTGGGHGRKGVDPWKYEQYKWVRAQVEGWSLFWCPVDRVLDAEILYWLGNLLMEAEYHRCDEVAFARWVKLQRELGNL